MRDGVDGDAVPACNRVGGACAADDAVTGEAAPAFILGWEEWLALPELGLPAIKAKVDTGARTSALHAFLIEAFGPDSGPMVRFGIHPIPGRQDIEIYCSAPVVGRREVTSSNGEKEMRLVIATKARIGEREWPIEVTLTNRESMAYRMLLGRQAICEDMFVDPATSFRQPRLGYRLYRHLPRHDPVRRALRIALLARRPDAASCRLLAAAASARGHVLEVLPPDEMAPTFAGAQVGLLRGVEPLGHYDAVIARPAARTIAGDAAIVRQLELMGAYAVNGGDALDRMGNTVAIRQALAGAQIACSDLAVDGERGVAAGSRPRYRFLVVDGRCVAGMQRGHGRYRDLPERRGGAQRALAEQAAGALRLGLCRIDVAPPPELPEIHAVSALPSLGQFQRVTGVNGADAVMVALEARARSWVRRERPGEAVGAAAAGATQADSGT